MLLATCPSNFKKKVPTFRKESKSLLSNDSKGRGVKKVVTTFWKHLALLSQ
jgi:hypothetical protein